MMQAAAARATNQATASLAAVPLSTARFPLRSLRLPFGQYSRFDCGVVYGLNRHVFRAPSALNPDADQIAGFECNHEQASAFACADALAPYWLG
jgi:hypothetical protein